MNRIRSIAVSALLILLILVSGTYAWTAANKQAESRNMAMTIQAVSDVTTISCYALRYDGSLGAICYKIGEGNGEVLDVPMTEFDRIFRDRIVNTPLIYVLELGKVPNTASGAITIKVPCLQPFIQKANGDLVNQMTDDGTRFAIRDYISNVISVKINSSGPITEPTATTTQRIANNVNIFNTQKNAFANITSGERMAEFCSITTENGVTTFQKEQAVQIRLSYNDYAANLYDALDEDGATSSHLVLYIQFDYDEALMDAYIAHMTNDLDTDVDFADDLGVIQMLVGRAGN